MNTPPTTPEYLVDDSVDLTSNDDIQIDSFRYSPTTEYLEENAAEAWCVQNPNETSLQRGINDSYTLWESIRGARLGRAASIKRRTKNEKKQLMQKYSEWYKSNPWVSEHEDDEQFLEGKAELIFGIEKASKRRSSVVAAIVRSFHHREGWYSCYPIGQIYKTNDKRSLEPPFSGIDWFHQCDDWLTYKINDLIGIKGQKMILFWQELRSVLREAQEAFNLNFDCLANGVDELDLTKPNMFCLQSELLSIGSTAKVFDTLRPMMSSYGNVGNILGHNGEAVLIRSYRYSGYLKFTAFTFKFLENLYNPYGYDNPNVTVPRLAGIDKHSQQLVDAYLSRYRENESIDKAPCFKNEEFRKLEDYRQKLVKYDHDIDMVAKVFFPCGYNVVRDQCTLSPWARRFTADISLATRTNLFVWPKPLTSDEVFDQDWAPHVQFSWLKKYSISGQNLGTQTSDTLIGLRQALTMWQNISVDGNLLFDPNDLEFTLVLTKIMVDIIFGAERANGDSTHFCPIVRDASDNWFITIFDTLDGIRKVSCEYCNRVDFAINTRLVMRIKEIEHGCMLDFVYYLLQCRWNTTETKVKETIPVVKCDNPMYYQCDHIICDKLDFDIAALKLNCVGRICGACLHENFTYCTDGNSSMPPNYGFGFWHHNEKKCTPTKSARR